MKNSGSKRKKKNESGQAIVEYILLLSIVVATSAFFMKTLTGLFDKTAATMGAKIEVQIRTGNAPATIWNK